MFFTEIVENDWLISFPGKDVQISTIRYAITAPNTLPLNSTILSPELMLEMLRVVEKVEIQYCLQKGFDLSVCENLRYKFDPVVVLDMEFKVFDNQKLHCKQVREFNG